MCGLVTLCSRLDFVILSRLQTSCVHYKGNRNESMFQYPIRVHNASRIHATEFYTTFAGFSRHFCSHRSLLLLFSEFEFTHLVHILWAIHFSHSMYTFRHDGEKKIGNGTPSRSFWNIHRIHLIWETSENEWNTRHTNTHNFQMRTTVFFLVLSRFFSFI